MDKLKMKTKSKVDVNIEAVGKLFPDTITEVIKGYDEKGNLIYEKAIDFDVLKQELSKVIVEGKQERYQMNWPGKKEAILEANSPINKTLRPCRAESLDFDKTKNLYIEGDNIDVLKLLQETYLDKVKMIYIDPPYNTGNDSFVYPDNFAIDGDEFSEVSGQYDEDGNMIYDIRKNGENNGRFHSDWMNMMYPRLKLARDLLSDDGVILINIDEHEITNLQKILLQVFGETNDLGTIVWDKRNPKGDAKGISYQHEYIVIFAKNVQDLLLNNKVRRPKKNASKILKKAEQLFSNLSLSYTLDDVNKEFSSWINSQQDFSNGEKAYNKIDEKGDVFQSVSMSWPNKKKAPDDYFIPLIHPITRKPCPLPERGWRNPSATMQILLKNNLILFGKDENTQPRRKYLLTENMYENIPSMLYYGGSDDAMLKEMNIPFDTPKVVNIVSKHILSFTRNDDIILDFFSGSSTTAHAVMQLNAEDGGNRKFIMVQIPESCDEKSEAYKAGYKNICEIGKERIRRAGKKIREEHPDKSEKLDTGFRVLKVDSSNMKDVFYNPAEYKQTLLDNVRENIKEDRSGEDLLFQIMLDLGELLSSDIQEIEIEGKSVFNVGQGDIIACFDKNITDKVVTEIAKMKPFYAVFRDSSLINDAVATNFEQIFKTYSPNTIRKVL